MRTLALDTTEDKDRPNTLGLEDVVREAARRAALSDPDHPLDQERNKKLMWDLFRQLQTAGLGKAVHGRRGNKSRFEFNWSVRCKDLRRVLDEMDGQQPARRADAPVRPEQQPAPARPRPSARAECAADRDAIIALLQENEQKLHDLGVTSLSLFGSVARNQAGPDSDVDLLVTFREPITSEAFFSTKFFLEDLLGRPVDLLTEAALRDRVRKRIEPELVRVA